MDVSIVRIGAIIARICKQHNFENDKTVRRILRDVYHKVTPESTKHEKNVVRVELLNTNANHYTTNERLLIDQMIREMMNASVNRQLDIRKMNKSTDLNEVRDALEAKMDIAGLSMNDPLRETVRSRLEEAFELIDSVHADKPDAVFNINIEVDARVVESNRIADLEQALLVKDSRISTLRQRLTEVCNTVENHSNANIGQSLSTWRSIENAVSMAKSVLKPS